MKSIGILGFAIIAAFSCQKKAVESSLLNKVTAENSMQINYSMSGCFSFSQEELIISKSSNGFKYKLISKKGFPDSTIKTGDCDRGFAKAYAHFENQGKKLDNKGGCTTITSYEINTGNSKLLFTDGHCSFMEYDILKEHLK